MTSKGKRQNLLKRIKKLRRLLAEENALLWESTFREVEQALLSVGDCRNVSTPLTLLGVSERVLRCLSPYKVKSLETLGNIDTITLRKMLQRTDDRTLVIVLVQIHPQSPLK